MNQYRQYKQKAHPQDYAYHAQLEIWASKVMAEATVRLVQAEKDHPSAPEGYPDLRKQMKKAQNALVFGPEDRAPHALFFACRRMYQAKLLERLEGAGAFSTEERARDEVLDAI